MTVINTALSIPLELILNFGYKVTNTSVYKYCWQYFFYLIFLKWNWLRRTNQFNSKRPTVNCYMSTLTWITKAYTHTVSLRHALFILKVTINFHIKNTEFLDQNHTPPATDYSVHWILECILITSPWSFKLTLQKFDILLVRSTNKVIYNLIQNNNALTEATISQLNVTSSISSVNYLLLFDYWVYHKRIQICHRWQTCKHSQGYHFNTTNSSLSSVLISEKHKQGGTPLRPLKKPALKKGFYFQLSQMIIHTTVC